MSAADIRALHFPRTWMARGQGCPHGFGVDEHEESCFERVTTCNGCGTDHPCSTIKALDKGRTGGDPMTDQPTRIADLLCDDDYELLADALGGLWTAAPSRHAEIHVLAERTGIAPLVDYAGDDDE